MLNNTSISEALLSGILPNTLPTSQNICIEGTLKIDRSYAFLDAEISMGEGASIVFADPVNNGRRIRLVIENTFIHGCDRMWKGIVMNTGENVQMRMYDSTISDAEYAISKEGKSYLVVENTTFSKNYVGILLRGNAAVVNLSGNFYGCADCPFPLEDHLLPKYTGQNSDCENGPLAGIQLNNVPTINIGNTSSTSNSIESFTKLRNGVFAENSSFEVNNCVFDFIRGPSAPNSVGVIAQGAAIYSQGNSNNSLLQKGFGMNSSLTFNWCTRAIYCIGLGSVDISENNVDKGTGCFRVENGINSEIKVYSNNIISRNRGIELHNNEFSTNIEIEDNVIFLDHTSTAGHEIGIGVSDNGSPQSNAIIKSNIITFLNDETSGTAIQSGIGLVNANGYLIEDNVINMEALLESGFQTIGLRVHASQSLTLQNNDIIHSEGISSIPYVDDTGIEVSSSMNITLICNEVDDFDEGIIFRNPCPGTIFNSNNFGDHTLALKIAGDMAFIGPQENTGNRWLKPYDGTNNFAAFFDSDDQLLSQSKFSVPNPNTTEVNPIPNISPNNTNFFEAFILTPPQACPVDVIDSEPGCPINELDIAIMSDNFPYPRYEPEVRWINNRYLINKLKKNPELVCQKTLAQDYLSSLDNSTALKFYKIETKINSIFDPNNNLVIELKNNSIQLKNSINILYNKNVLLDQAIGTDSINLVMEIQSKEIQIEDLTTENLSLIEQIKDQRQNKINLLISNNEAISTSELFEENQKTVNDIYLKTVAQEIYSFTTQQVNQLETIGDQCPIEGGHAVFNAKSLLSVINGELDFDIQDCQTAQTNESIKDENNIVFSSLKVFPNPANTELKIQFPSKSIDKNRTLSIYNAIGQKVLNHSFNSQNKQFTIDTKNYQSGIYFLKLEIEGQQSITQKISIAH